MSKLDSREFYELMQTYRHSPVSDFVGTNEAYEAVKSFVREMLNSPAPEKGEACELALDEDYDGKNFTTRLRKFVRDNREETPFRFEIRSDGSAETTWFESKAMPTYDDIEAIKQLFDKVWPSTRERGAEEYFTRQTWWVKGYRYAVKPIPTAAIVVESKIIEDDGYARLEEHWLGVFDPLIGKRCRITIEVIDE